MAPTVSGPTLRSLALSLALAGVALGAVPADPPVGSRAFFVREAALDAGFTAHWHSQEKILDLVSPKGTIARLVLDEPFIVVQDRVLFLPYPMVLVQGAPALDPKGMEILLRALGETAAFESKTVSALPPPLPGPGPGASPAALPTATRWIAPVSVSHAAARPLTGAMIRTIVLDPGHGGKDPGARGPDGLREKDVCLDIALRLRRELAKRDPGLRVLLTRDSDVFISLQERTAIANRAKGDLFVSIHNNASPEEDVHGTQVFFFDSQSSDRAAADLSMRENGDANQLDILMTDLAKSIVRDQSIGFASLVQRAMGKIINLKHRDISYAPFYVLARTEMPAILVEVAFITNPREEHLLGDPGFRQRAAASIAVGVEAYARLAERAQSGPL
ncbi:MAG TPA: N-acetylmuramoyl-L-alanine amidase [bacterium]|nr:N-acetylmuramoyl-L-alanine amidase [bacterium]